LMREMAARYKNLDASLIRDFWIKLRATEPDRSSPSAATWVDLCSAMSVQEVLVLKTA